MNFFRIFFRVLPWRPVAALSALWWHITGRRLRARNLLRRAGGPLPFAYEFWIRNNERPEELQARAGTKLESWEWKPKFTVILNSGDFEPDQIARSIRSVERQVYPLCTLALVDLENHSRGAGRAGHQIATSWQSALDDTTSDFIVPLTAGDELSKWALFHFADALQSEPTAAVLYGDEDEVSDEGIRQKPWFKPRWNEELFLAQDYLSRACAIRATVARKSASEFEPTASLPTLGILLHAIRNSTGPIVHVPHIVTHVVDFERSPDQHESVALVSDYLAPMGAEATSGPFGSVKVSWPLPSNPPLVSLIIPTRDKVELLRPCVESVLERTRYQPFELLIVDNGSVEIQTLQYLDSLRPLPNVRVLPYSRPYNYSAINNYAARSAAGSYLCLLNNDTEVIEGDWLAEMMRYAVRPRIGAVGAKLLYADGTIQHAGVIVGIGDAAGHAHRNLPSHDNGYFNRAHLAQYVSAVTGACLVLDKRKFLAVGGLDEEAFAVAYNDVDLCLKLERAGWRNVYVPHAVLIHHESKSRGKDHSPGQIERYRRELTIFQDRWGAKSYDDPLFSPNLDRSSETFVIRF